MAAIHVLLLPVIFILLLSPYLRLHLPIGLFCSDLSATVDGFTNPPPIIHAPVIVFI